MKQFTDHHQNALFPGHEKIVWAACHFESNPTSYNLIGTVAEDPVGDIIFLMEDLISKEITWMDNLEPNG